MHPQSLTAVLLGFAALATPSPAEPTIKAAGIRVIRETYEPEKGDGDSFGNMSSFATFNTFGTGTDLALLVLPGEGALIDLNLDDSELTAFEDDKGTDLLTETEGFDGDGFASFPSVEESGAAAMVEIEASGLPAAGATSLSAEGVLVIGTASEKKAERSAAFELAEGTEIEVGGIALKVEGVGEPSFGDHALELEFETRDRAIERVASVRFFDAAGAEIESSGAGSSRMGFNNKFTYGRSYSLAKKPAGKITVEFELWADYVEHKVPFSVTAGLGG